MRPSLIARKLGQSKREKHLFPMARPDPIIPHICFDFSAGKDYSRKLEKNRWLKN